MEPFDWGKTPPEVFKNPEAGIKYLMEQDPATRDSDTRLALAFWCRVQRIKIPQEAIEAILKHGLTIEKVMALREHVQNRFGMWGKPETMQARREKKGARR